MACSGSSTCRHVEMVEESVGAREPSGRDNTAGPKLPASRWDLESEFANKVSALRTAGLLDGITGDCLFCRETCSCARAMPRSMLPHDMGDCIHEEGEQVCGLCRVCPCGSEWADPKLESSYVQVGPLHVYGPRCYRTVECYSLRCSREGCPFTLPYDGGLDAVFVYSRPSGLKFPGTAFTHDVVVKFLERIESG